MCEKCNEAARTTAEAEDIITIILDGGQVAVRITSKGEVRVETEDPERLGKALTFLMETYRVQKETMERAHTAMQYLAMAMGAVLSRLPPGAKPKDTFTQMPPKGGLKS